MVKAVKKALIAKIKLVTCLVHAADVIHLQGGEMMRSEEQKKLQDSQFKKVDQANKKQDRKEEKK